MLPACHVVGGYIPTVTIAAYVQRLYEIGAYLVDMGVRFQSLQNFSYSFIRCFRIVRP